MRFECYVEMQAPEGVDHHTLYGDILQQIEYADRLGYEVFSSIDHHYFPDFGISAAPLSFWAAAAQRTRNIRFRTLLHNTSLHNPTVLAGQINQVDHLTEGRLELGFGRGHAWEFAGKSDIPLTDVRPRSWDAIDILLKAFDQERFSHRGEQWNVEDVRVVPRPYQDSYRIYTGGTSDSTYRDAGERGWGIVVPPLLPYQALEEQFEIYRSACRENGHEPDIVFLHAVYMDDDEAKIRAEAEEAMRGFLENNAAPTSELPPEGDLRAADFHFYAEGILEQLAEKSWEEMTSDGTVWVGAPKRIVGYIEEIQEEIEGLTAVCIVPNYGGMDHWKSIKVMQMFAEDVIPHFQERPTPKV